MVLTLALLAHISLYLATAFWGQIKSNFEILASTLTYRTGIRSTTDTISVDTVARQCHECVLLSDLVTSNCCLRVRPIKGNCNLLDDVVP
jgi:hypothetical protein